MANEFSNSFKQSHMESALRTGVEHLMSEFSPIMPPIGLPIFINTNDSFSGVNNPDVYGSQYPESRPFSTSAAPLERSASAGLIPENQEYAESERISLEFKTAINDSSKVIVRMPPCDTAGSDIVIKRDGTIIHYLNLSPQNDGRNLVISLEKAVGADSGLTIEQKESLNDLISYTKYLEKEFSVEFPDSMRDETAKVSKSGNILREALSRLLRHKNQVPPLSAHQPPVDDAELNNRAFSNTAPPERSFDRSARSGTADNTRYVPSNNRDWTQVNLFDLLTDWFSADPETFQKLMPGLYKKIAGANGKLDATKLRKLLESKDPMMNNLKSQLPRLADSFPSAKHSTADHMSSSDNAVNKTGAVLAEKAAKVSEELGSSGYCAKGVSFAIERATGKVIWGNANDMRESLPEQGFTVSQSKQLKVGQVVHVYWTPEVYAQEQARRGPCPNYGDIAIIGKGRDGQLYAYNDAATPLNNYLQKSRYDWNTLKVFNPPSV